MQRTDSDEDNDVPEVEVIIPEIPETPQQNQTLNSTWSQDRQTLMDSVKDLVWKYEISLKAFVEFQNASPIPGDGQLQGHTAEEIEEIQDNWNEFFSTWVGSQSEDDGQRFPSSESLWSVHSPEHSSQASMSEPVLSSKRR